MDALTVGKSLIETNTATLLQEILKGYDSGISIVNVKLQDVHPPDEVKEAFKDVVSAREDQQKMINEAEGYKNNLIPKARGEGVQIVNDAQAYAEQTVLLAQGKASRFEQIYEEYRKAKDITKARIYIETMEEVLPKVNKVIADEKLGQNFMPFLPITNFDGPPAPIVESASPRPCASYKSLLFGESSFSSEEFIRPHKIVRIVCASPRIPDFRPQLQILLLQTLSFLLKPIWKLLFQIAYQRLSPLLKEAPYKFQKVLFLFLAPATFSRPQMHDSRIHLWRRSKSIWGNFKS